ncbi:hypothetical protein SAY86_001521 [Trapa natans]|uniref:TF-B3 domain-containing protein n=1 Tax=Trapa natans TaxID=22666 RepID=A0AAN7N3E5_TRANT|nr:hypothetical protein SAY86_001521 [Trapa natans]
MFFAGPDRAASEGSDGPWKLHKDLFSTDVGANWSHLLLPKADVETHILNAEMVTALGTPGKASCLRVRLVDDDEGRGYEGMKLTYYNSCNGYVLNGAWNKICKNRCLKVKDRVGLYWDPVDKVLHFSVRRRAEAARD